MKGSTVARRLRSLREDRHLTQMQLESEIQIGRRTIANLEGARTNPRADTLIAYADYFGVSTDCILCRRDDDLPKYGEWVLNRTLTGDVVVCSECGGRAYGKLHKFCPNCGVRMERGK